jgi:hypothetical protein
MFAVPILHTHKMLQQQSKVDVFAMDIAVFLSLSNLLAPATRQQACLSNVISFGMKILFPPNMICDYPCDLTRLYMPGKNGCWQWGRSRASSGSKTKSTSKKQAE